MGAAEAREAAAAAARANPPPPKPILPAAAAATTAASRAARTAGLPEHVRAGVPEEQRPASPASPSAPLPPAPPPASLADAGAAPAERPADVSLAKSGYWFEDGGDSVKVSVPLGPACDALGGAALAKDAAAATFSELGFRLEVDVGGVAHVLALPELAGRIVPERCAAKVRPTSRRVTISLVKREPRPWTKLTAV